MTGRYLLDTNIVIAIFNGDALLQQRLANSTEVFLSVGVLGELLYGALKSSHAIENRARIEQFATNHSGL